MDEYDSLIIETAQKLYKVVSSNVTALVAEAIFVYHN